MDTQQFIKRLESAIAELTALRSEMLSSGASVPATIEEEVRAGVCHYCKESLADDTVIRGLHQRCYRKVKRAIDEGHATEASFMQVGKLGPPGRQGRKPSQQMLDTLAEAQAVDKANQAAKKGRKRQ